MVKKSEFSLIRAEINHNYKDQLLIELSDLNIVHVKPRAEKNKIKKELEEKDPLKEKIKDIRKNLNNLYKKLEISEYDVLNLKVAEDDRIEFIARDLPELIDHIEEEIDFYTNRMVELNRYITKGKIELENLMTIKNCYNYAKKLNLNVEKIDSLEIFKFRIFTTFSKNLTNLKNLFEHSEFPNFYETFMISDDRIGFYIIYPKDKENEFNARIRLIHSEEVPILKRYLTKEGINFLRINKEINFIENLVSRYKKEQTRIIKDNMLRFAAINEVVQNIEEYNWAEHQFEKTTSNRLIFKFFIPSQKKEEILQHLFAIFKDNITIESNDISKKKPIKEAITAKKRKTMKYKKEPILKEEYLERSENDGIDNGVDLRESTPTIMKNFFLIRPFETITRLYGTPTYSEIDPTPIIAFTFPILFGMMFGDIGHGLILIIAGFIGGIVFRKRKGDTANFSWIIFFCGWAAFFIGFLYGEFLGKHELEIFGNIIWHLEPINLLSILPPPYILRATAIIGGGITILGIIALTLIHSRLKRIANWIIGIGLTFCLLSLILLIISPTLDITLYNPLQNIMNVFKFAIYIGVFHINLGWFIQFLNYWKQKRKYLGFSDSLMKILLLTGGTILIFGFGFDIYGWLSSPYPILLVLIPGVLLLGLKPFGKLLGISYLKEESFSGLLGEGSIEAFDTVLSVVSNVASYIRLLALALAHIALLYSINAMSTLIEGDNFGIEIVNLIGQIFGNIVVILIEGILVFINTLRLHFYEFFFKFYQGSGIEYFPFYLDNNYSMLKFRPETEKDIISEEIEREIDTEFVKKEIDKAINYLSKKFE
ncbi:MAG: V-type ATP synthase subunit I [Candidatus Hodarchaeota archaeon]